jgi:ABC-type sugar transport system ATPase subunit
MLDTASASSQLGCPLIEVQMLRKVFGEVTAVKDVSFSIPRGKITGLIGQNGAGKSTVIRMLAGVIRPDAGDILLDGQRIELRSAHDAHLHGLAFVHQELDDFRSLSVAENVALASGLPRRARWLVDWAELRRRASACLAELGSDLSARAPSQDLTVVQRRITMIASALYARASLLVLDEPTASLTPPEVEHLHSVLRRLRNQGMAILYVSHRLAEIISLCDDVLVMRNGSLVAAYSARETDSSQLLNEITGEGGQAHQAGSSEGRTASIHSESRALTVEDLRRHDVVRGVSFAVGWGEIVGLGGLVGSGRTEIARLIAGADAPTSGRIIVRGSEVSLRSPAQALRHGIALLPEDRRDQGLVQRFTISENITLASLARVRKARRLASPSRRKERSVAEQYMKRLAVRAASSGTLVGILSGGNQQKVMLARWLMRDPDILIFDEPTHGMDVGVKESVFANIRNLAEDGKAILVISSELADLERLCDRVVVIREGRSVRTLTSPDISEAAILAASYK